MANDGVFHYTDATGEHTVSGFDFITLYEYARPFGVMALCTKDNPVDGSDDVVAAVAGIGDYQVSGVLPYWSPHPPMIREDQIERFPHPLGDQGQAEGKFWYKLSISEY